MTGKIQRSDIQRMLGEGSVLNGRYRLDRKIGQGGFAAVYLSTDNLLKRQVAVKVLSSDLNEDKSFLARFEREAQSVASLEHPNILGIHDYGQAEGTAYLVMPYVSGGTLFDLLKQPPYKVGLEEAGRFLQQAGAALDFAHRRNIVHRDVKPQNMLISAEDQHLFVCDFGIAKVLTGDTTQNRTGVVGTISFMAPEQFDGDISYATDIYALGCVLFQLITGQLPYSGGTHQVMVGHMMNPVPSILERSGGQVLPTIQPVIEKALAKRPQDRFQTAAEFYSAYQTAISGGRAFQSNFAPGYPPSPSSPDYFISPTGPQAPITTRSPSNIYNTPTILARTPPTPPGFNPPPGQGFHNNPTTPPGMGFPTSPPNSGSPPTQPGVYSYPPGLPNQSTWTTPPEKKASGVSIGLITAGGGVLALVVIGFLIFLLAGRGSSDSPTPTLVSGIGSPSTGLGGTSPGATTPASRTSPGQTTAPSTQAVSPTVPAVDPALAGLKEANDTFFLKGDYTGAIDKFKNLVQLYPASARAWRDYGSALHIWGRDAGGVEPLEKSLLLDPKDPLAYLYITDTYLDNYQTAQGEKAAKMAAQLDPGGWIGHAALALYYSNISRYDLVNPEVAALKQLGSKAGGEPYYNWVLGFASFFIEDYPTAKSSIDKTLAIWPKAPLALSLKAQLLLYSPGRDSTSEKEGVAIFNQLLQASPDSSSFLANLADYYYSVVLDNTRAEKYARDTLAKNPNNPTALRILGGVQALSKDYDSAFQNYDKCIKVNEYAASCYQEWDDFLINRGDDYETAGNTTEATAAYNASLTLSLAAAKKFIPPTGSFVHNSRYNSTIGVCYYRLKDFNNALTYFKKAVADSPDSAYNYGWLGLAYFSLSNKAEARNAYNKGLSINPDESLVKAVGDRLNK